MEKTYEKVQQYKKASIALFMFFAVFFGCCYFPLFNISYPEHSISPISFVIGLIAYHEMGRFEALIFPQKSFGFVLVSNMAHIFLGMGARLMIEIGEISNEYNFTIQNIALHMVICVSLCTAAYYKAKKSLNIKA